MSVSPTIVKSKNMDELWLDVNDKILWATKDELAYISSLDTMVEDCLFMAQSCHYTMNIGQELWLTPMRWTTLIRQYIDPATFLAFLDIVRTMSHKGRGIAAMDMKGVKPTVVDDSPRANRRKHGGCMRMITYRNYPSPTVSLYSRTSYLGYIGGIDMMLAHKVAEQVAVINDLQLKDIRFRWHIEMAQFHGFKSMAFIFMSSKENVFALRCSDKQFHERFGEVNTYPTWKLVRYWFKRLRKHDKEGLTYDQLKYGAEIRIRRRMHAFLGIKGFGGTKNKEAEPLSTPIEKLTLDRVMEVK